MTHRPLPLAVVLAALSLGCSRAPEEPAAAATAGDDLAVVDETLAPHFGNAFRAGDVRFTGRPTPEGLKAAREQGVGLIVNILTEEETAKLDFDEEATAAELGLEYVHLPLPDRKPTREAADRLADLLEGREDGVLVHCGSSNRVGALWAAYQGLHAGATPEEAIARGRAAGMRSDELAAAVEELLREP